MCLCLLVYCTTNGKLSCIRKYSIVILLYYYATSVVCHPFTWECNLFFHARWAPMPRKLVSGWGISSGRQSLCIHLQSFSWTQRSSMIHPWSVLACVPMSQSWGLLDILLALFSFLLVGTLWLQCGVPASSWDEMCHCSWAADKIRGESLKKQSTGAWFMLKSSRQWMGFTDALRDYCRASWRRWTQPAWS